ncbi:MAG: hypothetical protein SGPRY_008156, partial [Prymnesium sp.]
GPHGSLEQAVYLLKEYRTHFFVTAGLSLLCLVFAAILMSWMKMGAGARLTRPRSNQYANTRAYDYPTAL